MTTLDLFDPVAPGLVPLHDFVRHLPWLLVVLEAFLLGASWATATFLDHLGDR